MLKSSLRSGEIDAALFYAVSDGEFASRSLAPEPLVAVLPEDHLLAKHRSIALEDLAQEKFILPPISEAEVLHHAVFAECAGAGFQPAAVQEVATLLAGLGLIAARSPAWSFDRCCGRPDCGHRRIPSFHRSYTRRNSFPSR
jgi:DNA-binding transcriptional LysR family regulator